MISRNTIISFAAVTIFATAALVAGPLNPPAGPVTPTFKTLAEVEPRIAISAANTPGDANSLFKITQRGSYYLSGNVSGVAGRHGIEIAASGVTIDLNGFDVAGVAGSLTGITVSDPAATTIVVLNGTVRLWGEEGVELGPFNFDLAPNCRVQGVIATENTGDGISIGNGGTITNCSSNSNGGVGIKAGSGSTITHCSAVANTGTGIVVSEVCTVANCSAYDNGLVGGAGILTGDGCTIVDCSAGRNNIDGIICTDQCTIRGNTCALNGNGGDGAGILATGTDNRIEGNNCTGADRGIDVDGAGNIIIRNTCSGNTTNWDIAMGNALAPIVAASTNVAPVAGNTYASSLGSTDPNANFTY